jgi:hypothetical protein
MPLIHLFNEVISLRELGPQSWATYISYSLNESTGAIIAESFSVFHNSKRPRESYRLSIGMQRVSHNKAPLNVTRQLRLLADIIPPQPSDTISYEELARVARASVPTSPTPAPMPA